ncbi:MAG: ribonuclease T [Alphaproteobacteria bacterium]|nr:ribonuclease T [Alphaproteobacteria bacterium]
MEPFLPQGWRLYAGFAALLFAGFAAFAGLSEGPITAARPRPAPATPVEHYVLALSWSPSYCAEEADKRDHAQCGRPLGFIVHGLWPQFADGRREKCDTDAPRVPNAIIDRLRPIMPSAGLIGYQWRKHGACTGLSQGDYFATLEDAYHRVRIPDALTLPAGVAHMSPEAVEAAFIAANPDLTAPMLDITCSTTRLREVRICLTPALDFVACAREGNSCRQGAVEIPPVSR